MDGPIEGLPMTAQHPLPVDEEAVENDTEAEADYDSDADLRSIVERTEEPGIDSVRGTLGIGALGSLIRARNTLRRVRSRTATEATPAHPNGRDLEKGFIGSPSAPLSGANGRNNGHPVLNAPPNTLANSVSVPNLGRKRPSSIRFAGSGSEAQINGLGTASPNEMVQTSNNNISGARPAPPRSQTLPTALEVLNASTIRRKSEEEEEEEELDEKEG